MRNQVRHCAAQAASQLFALCTKGASHTSKPLPCSTTQFRLPPSFLIPGFASIPSHRALTTSQRSGRADVSYTEAAKDLNQKGLDQEEAQLEDSIEQEKEKQIRTPWHREGSDVPPVDRQRSAGAMTKGKLLTTPSRLLKLILPLTTNEKNTDRKDVEPLALLVHPQQPLSYLERLIQSELPSIKDAQGEDKIPVVHFRAEDSTQDELTPKRRTKEEEDEGDLEATKFDGGIEKTGKLNRRTPQEAHNLRGGAGEGGVESYSGLGHEAESAEDLERRFVRWSSSTEIGDFIRDAARGKEFAVEIEGMPKDIRVGVPSFNDRTHYLRIRLRKTAKKIMGMADVKQECDKLAHRGAQRVAIGGFGILVGWWYLVYRLTFETDLGWDTMEPVTYLVGLSTLMCGYLWFLYHNREVSYRAALNLSISRRQNKLYQAKGFDLQKWEALIDEGNALRREIKAVANEYDVEWDEMSDEQDERVKEALKTDRDAEKRSKGRNQEERKEKERDEEDEK
ncbi:MAG: hypothetical protein M1827_003198 [Pycnora praestabilis]|nr:MAG: hypothetical protein M1827_003198 [Pycnora praestabilis]